ncbi:4-alpha-glucanotransferase DPE2 isoform X1 [Selaginella moellendorffii]|uniref:4-alpha-glucanotransferase DPE2 isoform X1 n=1 Tax=Selaginella moellendorffii TaxID=88036 RepID=UPI000D1C6896|nr:4-alpha-glucanotransferase DPE2 isoform X1 [Selaginella moellendorffii]|eukprot:XP_024540103.1 4-alpha-glucanotransferase DPE2 isoform X1 [Selaginella moellendorffii]
MDAPGMDSSRAIDRERAAEPRRVSLRFRIPYFTQWGQNLIVTGSHSSLGSWNLHQGLAMVPHHDEELGELVWTAQLAVREGFQARYSYCVVDDKRNAVRREAGIPRSFVLPDGIPNGSIVDLYDLWQEGCSPESLLSRSAFRDAIFRNSKPSSTCEETSTPSTGSYGAELLKDRGKIGVCFQLSCSILENGQTVYVTGSSSSLGSWDYESALKLTRTGDSSWHGCCAIDKQDFPVKYIYFLKDLRGEVTCELGDGRKLSLDSTWRKPSSLIIVSDGHFKGDLWRGAGLAIPVFSIRTHADVGAGEFLDLKLLVDLAVKSGLRLLQLLPVNDTSVHGMWWDSYPYSSLSVFALHPLYLSLEAMTERLPQELQDEISQARKKLDLKVSLTLVYSVIDCLQMQDVDYEGTMKTKLSIAKKIFHIEKEAAFNSSKFKTYFDENKHWLEPFAAFCFLRDLFGTADHSQWGRFSTFSPEKLEKLVSPSSDHYNLISFTYFLQYHLHSQLTEASEYARNNGVVLKGDLPIGVDRNSVDTWVFPTLFRMNTSTGAPPDYFDKNGQNWGFPTYNWEEMSKDNFAWWRARLTQMSKYFTAYRIDHILGFFRIWELPAHAVTGLTGKFRPSLPLTQEELEAQGIWDFNRLSEPYVRCHTLQAKFGDAWSEIASKYFDEYEHLCYKFKKEYDTERKILGAVSQLEDSKKQEQIKGALFDLLRDVVLMRDPEDSRKFYPRFGMEDTSNFKELDEHSKNVLQRLYYDYFYHRQEGLWRENALKTLPVLMSSSEMLTCGEDLGMVPACVAPVLNELGLLGLRIQRMPSTPGQEFGNPLEYEYMTVCAPSCHDCSTMRAWWEDDEGRRIRFYKDYLGMSESPPAQCVPDVARVIIEQHMKSPSMWAIFPLQDLLALKEEYTGRPANEETINDPTNPKHYWRFRTLTHVETLLEDRELIFSIKNLVESGGRGTKSLENGFESKMKL